MYEFTLNKENDFTTTFEVECPGMASDYFMILGVITDGQTADITVSNIEFTGNYIPQPTDAQSWTADNDLPGLGLSNSSSWPENLKPYTYTFDNGNITLGLCYDETNKNFIVTGFNISDESCTELNLTGAIPFHGRYVPISCIGYNGTFDWSGANNLTTLKRLNSDCKIDNIFAGSPLTDLYVGYDSTINCNPEDVANIYLHIDSYDNRDNYSSLGFKRVLVGDETPDWPQSDKSDVVVPTGNEGEYIGISKNDDNGNWYVTEIFTEAESINLPIFINDNYIGGLGMDSEKGPGTLCANAPNLKSATLGEHYLGNTSSVDWDTCPSFRELHLTGGYDNWNVVNQSFPSDMVIYVPVNYYKDYINSGVFEGCDVRVDPNIENVDILLPGEYSGEYYGIKTIDQDGEKLYYISEIVSDREEITLPVSLTDEAGQTYEIAGLCELNQRWNCCGNLRSLTIPATYRYISGSFLDGNIPQEVHMLGDVPTVEGEVYYLPVYVKAAYYENYLADSAWSNANIIVESTPLPENYELPGAVEGESFVIGKRYDRYVIERIISDHESVTLPESFEYEGNTYNLYGIGNDSNKGSGYLCEQAPNLKELTIPESYDGELDIDWSANPFRVLHILKRVSYSVAYSTVYQLPENMYVYIPDYEDLGEYLGYKNNDMWEDATVMRESYVSVPGYPDPKFAEIMIPGSKEGEFFGIIAPNSSIFLPQLTEIYTDQESVVLPSHFTFAEERREVKSLNGSYEKWLFKHAPNLRSITIPESYTGLYVNWENCNIRELHMLGAKPDISDDESRLTSEMTVYVPEDYYDDYAGDWYWNSANIVAVEEEPVWMTVNVGRKGEFAQTYIEMTDGDWSKGKFVKVTGQLNETDLNNVKNLTNLRKLDLTEATFAALPENFLSPGYSRNSKLNEVMLPESLTTISNYAFSNCQKLKSVTAPGITTIGNDAFQNCNMLETLDISNVTVIGQSAFESCYRYNPGALSAALTKIGQSAFYNTQITELVLPEGITEVPYQAFAYCHSLLSVTLPSTLKYIQDYAFRNCEYLNAINFPEGMTLIGNSAFYNCAALTEITLPSTLTEVRSGAFNNCSGLRTVKCKAIVPPAANGEFTSGMDLTHCTLYVAPFSIDAYRDADYWNRFYIVKPLNEPVEYIYVGRPMSFDLQSEDNAVLQNNPDMTLGYSIVSGYNYKQADFVGQLSASGDGTLSAGNFNIFHCFARRGYSSDLRTTLVNNAENMRADNVMASIQFETNTWHFISFQYDVQMKDIYSLYDTDFVIREYDSANRALGDNNSANWKNVPADGVLLAGKGYIIQAANNNRYQSSDGNTYTYPAIVRFPSRNTTSKNNLFTSDNVIVPLEEYQSEFAHNRSWNLVGNPYPCYFDMHCLMEDFTSPIVIWRGTSYQAYSPVDDDLILRPNEAFFVQRPLDKAEIVFGSEGRMHYAEAYNSSMNPGSKAPAFSAASDRAVFNFNIEGCGSDDRTRIVMNEQASRDYEMNCDAAKFFSESGEGVEIYVNDNVKYDICERPLSEGKAVIGTRTAAAGEYTLSLSGRNYEGWTVILTDTLTGNSVDLTGTSYTFVAEQGETEGRFIITFKAPGATGLDGVDAAGQYVRIYSTTGIFVFEGNINDFKASASAGVYVVTDADKTYKVVIK